MQTFGTGEELAQNFTNAAQNYWWLSLGDPRK